MGRVMTCQECVESVMFFEVSSAPVMIYSLVESKMERTGGLVLLVVALLLVLVLVLLPVVLAGIWSNGKIGVGSVE